MCGPCAVFQDPVGVVRCRDPLIFWSRPPLPSPSNNQHMSQSGPRHTFLFDTSAQQSSQVFNSPPSETVCKDEYRDGEHHGYVVQYQAQLDLVHIRYSIQSRAFRGQGRESRYGIVSEQDYCLFPKYTVAISACLDSWALSTMTEYECSSRIRGNEVSVEVLRYQSLPSSLSSLVESLHPGLEAV